MKKIKLNKKLIFGIILVAFIFGLAYYISANYFQLMLIQGKSMEPSYKNLSLVIVDKQEKSFSRGDVVAFKCEGVKGVLVKRVVAIPHDKLVIEGGKLFVNGALSEHMVAEGVISYAGLAKETICLGEDEYFVLGDNYGESKDSRYDEIGIITSGDIIGKVKQ